MRHLVVCFLFLISSLSVLAAEPEATPAPGLMVPFKHNQEQAAVTIDPVKEGSYDPNALEVLQTALRQNAAQEHTENENRGVFKSTTMRLPKELITFTIAQGLIIAESMWSESHGDPMAMEKLILSLKDPLASFSFYSFMIANGYTMHIRTKGLPATMDAQTRAQMARRFSYEGMVWGSLASTLISDIFGPYLPCLKKRYADYRFTKDLQEKCTQGLNTAWQQWTLRGKFNQYAPQILSLLISQRLAEFADGAVRGAGSWVSKRSIVQKYLSKDAAKKMIFKITGGDVALMIFPGTLAVKSIAWTGKLFQFSGFLFIDHFFSPTIYRTFNNLWKPLAFDFDALAIHRLWNEADTYQWDEAAAANDKLSCAVQTPNCHKFDALPKEIENFTIQTQQWREHLNAVNEQTLVGWMELSKKLLNQVSLSYSFYKNYAESLFDTLNTNHRVSHEGLTKDVYNNKSLYPYRQLPLFGVKFLNDEGSKETSVEDQYYLSPQKMEKYQIGHIQQKLSEVDEANFSKYSERLQKIWTSLVSGLTSSDLKKVADALVLLNTITGEYGIEQQQKLGVRNEIAFINDMKKFRETLGDPKPVLYDGAGFSQAHSVNSSNLETAREANFSWSGRTYSFNKDADYLTYQMVCGPSKGDVTDNWFFSDDFIPPKMINENNKPVQICNSAATYITSERLYSLPLTNEKTRAESKNITAYITNHINPAVLGDWKNKDKKADFDKWWLTNVKESIRPKFVDLDKRFQILTNKNYDVIFGEKKAALSLTEKAGHYVRKTVDVLNQSDYLPKTLLASFKWELEVYLDILQSTVNKSKPLTEDLLYLKMARKNSEDYSSQGVYGYRNKEITDLKNDFNIYFSKLNSQNITFEDYSAASKKLRERIEAIKLLTGLCSKKIIEAKDKKPVTTCTTASTFNLAAQPECTTTTPEEKFEIVDLDPKEFKIKHKTASAAINGLNLLESEVRRFIRMKLLISQTLDLDTKEFMSDITNSVKGQQDKTKVRSASIRGE